VVIAVKVASRMSYTFEDVLEMPMSKLLMIAEALDVVDGKKKSSIILTESDKEMINFLDENRQEIIDMLEKKGDEQ
jgi:hypothetical protein